MYEGPCLYMLQFSVRVVCVCVCVGVCVLSWDTHSVLSTEYTLHS